MTTALATTATEVTEAGHFSSDQVDLIKRTIAKGATNDELQLFINQCQRTGLDPFNRQIYFVKYGGNMSIITGIDGYRLQADRTGKYAGNDDPVFEERDGKIIKASVTVYKIVKGVRCAFTATARWEEYASDKNPQWKKMPYTMLGKCAEALALRKAFPAELSGLYTKEEMDQADNKATVSAQPQTNEVNYRTVTKSSPEFNIYKGTPEQKRNLVNKCKEAGVREDRWKLVHELMHGKPLTHVNTLIGDALKETAING